VDEGSVSEGLRRPRRAKSRPSKDHARCDRCGLLGRLRPGYSAPDFWFYFESPVESKPGVVHVSWVCSEACRDAIWKRGPGEYSSLEREVAP
jgi:hypothetical protein